MVDWLLDKLSSIKGRVERARLQRRWENLRGLGMHIGSSVWLPASTWIDTPHCYLISIGDNCGFGEECMILAHDAQMDEFLDAARIGRVTLHDSCHIGARTVILPGVEIGPRTLVGANSVVARSLPPDSVCAGSPAKMICSLEDYLRKHRDGLMRRPRFEYLKYDVRFLTPERLREVVNAVADGDAYIVGGYSAERHGLGGTPRTAVAGAPEPKS